MLFLPVLLAFQLAQPSLSLLQDGLRALQAGDLVSARADLEQASREDPSNAYVWATLAEVYGRIPERDLANGAAQKAEKMGADNPVIEHALAIYYSHAGDWANAARCEEQYASSPTGDKGAISRAANWYIAAGDDTKASSLGSKLADDVEQTFELVQTLLRKQDFANAADLLDAGLKTHPDDAQLTLALGAARYGQRRFEDAIVAFLKVMHTNPEVPQSYVFLSKMLDQAGPHLDDIVSGTGEWAQKHPDNAAAQLAYAKSLLEKDPGSKQAEERLQQSIQLDPGAWEAHYELGLVWEQAHQFGPAAEEFRKATELDPVQATPHYHLARMYDRLGNREGAAAERAIHQKLLENGSGPMGK